MMTTGQKIKKARKAAGLTQKQLGELLGVKQAAISALEKDRTNIKYSTLEKIAEQLKVSVFELSDDIEKLFKNHIKEFDSLIEIGEQFLKLMLQHTGKEITCEHDIGLVEDYKGDPIPTDVLSVFCDGELCFSVEPHKLKLVMDETLKFFEFNIDKYKLL